MARKYKIICFLSTVLLGYLSGFILFAVLTPENMRPDSSILAMPRRANPVLKWLKCAKEGDEQQGVPTRKYSRYWGLIPLTVSIRGIYSYTTEIPLL